MKKYTDAPFVIRQTAAYPIVGPRQHADYFRNSLLALYPPPDGRDVRCIVAILNSKLIRFAYTSMIHEAGQKAFPQVKVRSVRALPIHRLDGNSQAEIDCREFLSNATDRLIEMKEQEIGSSTPQEQTVLTRRIAALDREIDQHVYALYGLTPNEITLVEQATAT